MRDQDYTQSLDFLNSLFSEAVQQIELRACPNVKGDPGAKSLMTRDPESVVGFCRQKDVPGMGVYFGVCTRKEGATSGSLENVAECPALWVDIDCAKQGISGAEAIAALEFLPSPPSFIVNSGGGLHAYWLLENAVDVSEGSQFREVVSDALKALARILAGDMKVTELARIMRLPGTRNSKEATLALYDGEPALCEVLSATGRVHDLEQLVEWLGEQRAVLQGKAEPARPVNEADPFVAYARSSGWEPSIDIDAALAAMEHGANGDNSIHQTQLRVSASMLARGYDEDEIVDRILAATEKAAPRDKQWNWAAEERGIRKMIAGARAKSFDKKAEERPRAIPQANGNTALKLIHNADVEPDAKPKSRESRSQTVATGKAVISVWQDRHGPIIHANGSTYVYEGGIWVEWDERLAQRLRAIIQEACASLGNDPKTALLNAVKAYFMDRPELHRGEIRFDQHGILIADDACLDFKTMEIIPHSPDHFATTKVVAKLEGDRRCETLTGFLTGAFADRPEAKEIIATLQEWFGSAIVSLSMKTRDMKKGLLVHGPSRSSKTQVSELARHLLGHEYVSGARMSDLEDRFGREPLIGKRGWIADDAIGEAETLDAETYKVVVTGERTSAKRKGGKNWEGRFGIPVMLTANNMPRVRDQSDATYNRSLILPMTNVRPKGAPEPAGYDSIAAKIGSEELTGLLWWAIEGWRRLSARGDFAEPDIMRLAGQSFKDENNPVGAWLASCSTPDPLNKIARLDLVASFNGWRSLEHDDDKAWKSHTVIRRIRGNMPNLGETKYAGERMFIGIRLNEDGLFAWQRTKDTAGFEKKMTFSSEKEEVNRCHAPSPSTDNGQEEEAPRDARPRF